jgi:hypothetical protein
MKHSTGTSTGVAHAEQRKINTNGGEPYGEVIMSGFEPNGREEVNQRLGLRSRECEGNWRRIEGQCCGCGLWKGYALSRGLEAGADVLSGLPALREAAVVVPEVLVEPE